MPGKTQQCTASPRQEWEEDLMKRVKFRGSVIIREKWMEREVCASLMMSQLQKDHTKYNLCWFAKENSEEPILTSPWQSDEEGLELYHRLPMERSQIFTHMCDLLELPNNWVNRFNGLYVLKCAIFTEPKDATNPFSPWTAKRLF